MGIQIKLSLADVMCLISNLSTGSALLYTLINAIPSYVGLPLNHSAPIDCDVGEARGLLRIANESCPEVVPKIEHGLRLSGVTNF